MCCAKWLQLWAWGYGDRISGSVLGQNHYFPQHYAKVFMQTQLMVNVMIHSIAATADPAPPPMQPQPHTLNNEYSGVCPIRGK